MFGTLLLASLFVALLLAPPAQAGKGLGFGVLGTGTTGAGAGQLNNPNGIAVNTTGAGGVTAGDVYVADTLNSRISVFSATGAFVRAFGRNVVASGPGDSTQGEVQSVTIKATSGQFALGFGGQTTGLLNYNAPASGGVGPTASVQNALEGLSTIGAGNVSVTGGPGDAAGTSPYLVTFQGALAGKDLANMTIAPSALAIAVGTEIACTGSASGNNYETTGFKYQWLADGVSLGAANGAQTDTYTIQPADAGKVVQCQVTALQKKTGAGAGSGSQSAAVQVQPPGPASQTVVAPFPATAPPSTTQAALAKPTGGAPAAGKKIKCAPGTWTGSPTFSYQWYRGGVELVGNGADTIEYTVQSADVASPAMFQCAVKATNAGGTSTLFSISLDFGFGILATPAPAASAPVSAVGVVREGGGVEVCMAGVDICQAGENNALTGSLSAPQGIAVDQTTGNLFVTSAGASNRIDVFSATGQFQGAIGWGVKLNGSAPELQLCTEATQCKAAQTGTAAGQMGGLSGTISPAIDPNSGNLYVPDSGGAQPGNARVNEFALTLNGSQEVTGVSFVRAFGGDVAPTINERQTLTLSGASGGTFELGFDGKSTGGTGVGDTEAGSNEIANVTTAAGTFVAGEQISSPGIPAGTRITAASFDSLTLSANATASAAGISLASELPFDASAAAVQGSLRALPAIGSTGVTVSGADGGPWAIEFTGSLSGKDVADLGADASGLTGSSPAAAVSTVQTGANGTSIGLEVCTVATTCKAGLNLNFNEFLDPQLKVFYTNDPDGLAVDSSGGIYALSVNTSADCSDKMFNCSVLKFDPAVTAKTNFAPEYLQGVSGDGGGNSPTDVAIDPGNDHVVVAKRVGTGLVKFFEFTKEGQFLEAYPPGPGISTGTGVIRHGMALGIGERLYYNDDGAKKIRILAPPPAPTVTIDVPGVPSATSVAVSGTVTPPPPGSDGGYETLYQFEYSRDGVKWTASSDASAVGNGTGAGSPNSCPTNNPPICKVAQTLTGLEPGATYLVRLQASTGTKATTAPQAFTTTAQTPTISGLRANPVGQTSATLVAEVNPNNQATTYYFEWGTDESYGTRIPADFDAVAGSGGAPVRVTANLTGLALNTTHHFRLVAGNGSGIANGADHQFRTLNAAGLPANRGIELVSPAEKRPTGSAIPVLTGRYQAAEDGHGIAYPIINGLADSTAGGVVTYASTRSQSQWSAMQMSGSSQIPTPTGDGLPFSAEPNLVLYVSPNMNCAILHSYSPLTADTPAVDVEFGVANLYRWNADDGTFTLLTNRIPSNPDNVYPEYLVHGASSDCSRIFFSSDVFDFLPGASGLYEWEEGALRDAGMRQPNLSPAPSIDWSTGNLYRVGRNGNLFFVATSDQGTDSGKSAVFVRKSPTEIVNVSRSTTATPTLGAQFLAASPDGSHVYFSANYGLTPVSSSGPAESCTSAGGPGSGIAGMASGNLACALYDYDVEAGTLTDLSATSDSANGKGAVVQGVLDVSDDGSVVYFAAKAQLVPGEGRTYAQNQQGVGYANVYRSQGGELEYVGSISTQDMTGSGSNGGAALIQNPRAWNSQTTKSGEYLLFVSSGNGSSEPQAYLYSAQAGVAECVSCPVPGRPAIADPQFFRGPTSDSTSEQTSAVRSLSEDGRVFFNANDALTPDATQKDGLAAMSPDAENNIYEWHEGQVALLATGRSSLLDVGGRNGEDVFIRSFEQLAPTDIDFAADIYDIKADGGFAPPPEPPAPCDPAADQCQGVPVSPPSSPGSPPSADFNGPGNPPAAKTKKPRCPKGKVRKHGKCVKKKQSKKKQRSHRRGRPTHNDRGGVK